MASINLIAILLRADYRGEMLNFCSIPSEIPVTLNFLRKGRRKHNKIEANIIKIQRLLKNVKFNNEDYGV